MFNYPIKGFGGDVTSYNGGNGSYGITSKFTWHGGLHIRPVANNDLIRPISDGVIIAYRFGPISNVVQKIKGIEETLCISNNFILMQHVHRLNKDKFFYYYSLYYNLCTLDELKKIVAKHTKEHAFPHLQSLKYVTQKRHPNNALGKRNESGTTKSFGYSISNGTKTLFIGDKITLHRDVSKCHLVKKPIANPKAEVNGSGSNSNLISDLTAVSPDSPLLTSTAIALANDTKTKTTNVVCDKCKKQPGLEDYCFCNVKCKGCTSLSCFEPNKDRQVKAKVEGRDVLVPLAHIRIEPTISDYTALVIFNKDWFNPDTNYPLAGQYIYSKPNSKWHTNILRCEKGGVECVLDPCYRSGKWRKIFGKDEYIVAGEDTDNELEQLHKASMPKGTNEDYTVSKLNNYKESTVRTCYEPVKASDIIAACGIVHKSFDGYVVKRFEPIQKIKNEFFEIKPVNVTAEGIDGTYKKVSVSYYQFKNVDFKYNSTTHFYEWKDDKAQTIQSKIPGYNKSTKVKKVYSGKGNLRAFSFDNNLLDNGEGEYWIKEGDEDTETLDLCIAIVVNDSVAHVEVFTHESEDQIKRFLKGNTELEDKDKKYVLLKKDTKFTSEFILENPIDKNTAVEIVEGDFDKDDYIKIKFPTKVERNIPYNLLGKFINSHYEITGDTDCKVCLKSCTNKKGDKYYCSYNTTKVCSTELKEVTETCVVNEDELKKYLPTNYKGTLKKEAGLTGYRKVSFAQKVPSIELVVAKSELETKKVPRYNVKNGEQETHYYLKNKLTKAFKSVPKKSEYYDKLETNNKKDELVETTYEDLGKDYKMPEYLLKENVLIPRSAVTVSKNDKVTEVNASYLKEELSGKELNLKAYLSQSVKLKDILVNQQDLTAFGFDFAPMNKQDEQVFFYDKVPQGEGITNNVLKLAEYLKECWEDHYSRYTDNPEETKRKLQNQRFLRHYAISTVRSQEVMLKMSRSIWKHQSEWASHSNNYMSDLEEFYVAEFKDILDRYPKVDKDDLEDEIEESKQNVHNQLDTHNWWQDVCKGSSAFKDKPAILDDKNLNKPKDEKETPKIKLQTFSSDSLVYYFHPVAFVEAMRRVSNRVWDSDDYYYNKFLPTLYKHEGGYQNDISDSGNYVDGVLIGTNHGISAPVLKEYLGRTPTVEEMKNLTKATATEIYKKNFWTCIRVPEIDDKYVAIQYADMYINGGGNSVKIMKRALNNLGYSTIVNSKYNDPFIEEVNTANASKLHEEYKNERIKFYKELVKKKPSMKKWEEGWITRAKSFIYGKD